MLLPCGIPFAYLLLSGEGDSAARIAPQKSRGEQQGEGFPCRFVFEMLENRDVSLLVG